MAAILEPRPFPLTGPARPPRRADLRLVHSTPSGPARPAPAHPVPILDGKAVAAAVVALVVAMALALAIGRGAFAGLAPAPPAPRVAVTAGPAGGPAVRSVVVQPGDSLWSIARRIQPSGEVRDLVDRLVAAHGSSVIVPGERIALPN